MVIVQLVKVGSEVRSFDVSDNATLGNLLDKAGEQFVPNTISINTYNGVNRDTRLNNNDRVFIGNKVKGNSPYVIDFIRLGQGEVISVSAEDTVTIGQAISMMSETNKARFIDANGNDSFQYQISGQTKTSSDTIPMPQMDGGSVRVLCAMKVKGN